MKNKKTKPLPTIDVNGTTWVFDRHGALCYQTTNPTLPGDVFATARQIDGIYAASHSRATVKHPDFPDTEENSVHDAGDGVVDIGCQRVYADDVARVYRASQKARRARPRK